jgi:hypothetical protein
VSCRVGIIILNRNDSIEDHIHLGTSIVPNGHSTKYLEYVGDTVSIRSTSWRCRVN